MDISGLDAFDNLADRLQAKIEENTRLRDCADRAEALSRELRAMNLKEECQAKKDMKQMARMIEKLLGVSDHATVELADEARDMVAAVRAGEPIPPTSIPF